RTTLKLIDKFPSFSRNPGLGLTAIFFSRVMVAIKCTPTHWISVTASFEGRTNMRTTSACGFRCIGCTTAVIARNTVADGAALRNIENGVKYSVRAEVCNWLCATLTAAQLRTGIKRNTTENIRTSTGDCIRHASTVAEPCSKYARIIDTQSILHLLKNFIGQLQISTTRISPAGIQAFRCHEDRGVVGQIPQTIERIFGRTALTAQ